MNLIKFIQCLFKGHAYTNSKRKKGYMTCARCRWRKKWR